MIERIMFLIFEGQKCLNAWMFRCIKCCNVWMLEKNCDWMYEIFEYLNVWNLWMLECWNVWNAWMFPCLESLRKNLICQCFIWWLSETFG